jgi:hypothetical protein
MTPSKEMTNDQGTLNSNEEYFSNIIVISIWGPYVPICVRTEELRERPYQKER